MHYLISLHVLNDLAIRFQTCSCVELFDNYSKETIFLQSSCAIYIKIMLPCNINTLYVT